MANQRPLHRSRFQNDELNFLCFAVRQPQHRWELLRSLLSFRGAQRRKNLRFSVRQPHHRWELLRSLLSFRGAQRRRNLLFSVRQPRHRCELLHSLLSFRGAQRRRNLLFAVRQPHHCWELLHSLLSFRGAQRRRNLLFCRVSRHRPSLRHASAKPVSLLKPRVKPWGQIGHDRKPDEGSTRGGPPRHQSVEDLSWRAKSPGIPHQSALPIAVIGLATRFFLATLKSPDQALRTTRGVT